MAINSFEDFLDAFKKRIPEGSGLIIDTSKMDELKKIYESKSKISKIEDFCVKASDVKNKQAEDKKKEEKQKQEQEEKQNKTVINEVAPSENKENTNDIANNQEVDNSWKNALEKEWRFWGSDQNLVYEDASLPNEPEKLSFRFYKSEKDKNDRNFDAEISYNGPNNLTLTSQKGKTPDEKYFQKAVELAMKDGTAIEFGEIKSAEFKAKLLAACIKSGAAMVNMPDAEEMSKWPDELKKMVEDAKAQTGQTANTQEINNENKQEEQTQQKLSAAERIAALRTQIQQRNEKLNAATQEGKTLSKEEREAIEFEGMSAEEIKLRKLRGQAKDGDKKAAHELDQRRYNTMTDEFKYEREVDVDEKGQAKTDDKGKPVYKKDKDGNFVYKLNDKGQKIKTPQYEAFLKNSANHLSQQK